jgi:hypothetical protein
MTGRSPAFVVLPGAWPRRGDSTSRRSSAARFCQDSPSPNSEQSDYPTSTITVADLYGGAFKLAPPSTNTEGFSAKFNVNERLAWAVNTSSAFEEPLSDALNFGIAAAPQANVDYVVGQDADSNASFVEVLNDSTGQFVKFMELKLQPTMSEFSSPVDMANGVETDPAGNAYIVGTFSGTLIFPT